MVNRTYFSLLLILMLSSCSKVRRSTFISGQVNDYGSGQGIENVKIHLKDGWDGSGPFTDSDFTTDAETIVYTDDDGRFEAELKGQFNTFLFPTHEDYWIYDQGETAVTNQANGYEKGSDNEDEVIRLKAKAYFYGYIINSQPPDSARFISLTENYSLKIIGDFFLDERRYFTNNNPDQAIGNDHFRYRIEYKRDGAWNEVIDSVFIEKGDTLFQEIIF